MPFAVLLVWASGELAEFLKFEPCFGFRKDPLISGF
jgi:hypothetical protein